MSKKVALHNLGCKVNAYEVEAMQQLLEQAGYEIVPFQEGADVYLINTCTVTNIADRKSRQMLHKAKKMNPDAIVVATGCYAQTDTEKLKEDASVDLILGNNQKNQIVQALEEFEKEHERAARVIEINKTKEYEELSIDHTAEHVRAYIKVQDGCNQFCTYCIIPYARGRVRSRKITEILEEVRKLAAGGYKEVVLTGIHLSSYGVDFKEEDKKEDLLSLIRAVHEIEGIKRIRLGSLEPRIITEEFMEGISALPKVCPHFHLSLQSGCNKTLRDMNRRYSAEEYAEKCELIRKYYQTPALTTDVIVGFPQETEEDFRESYEFVRNIHFYETHIFKYSRRQGTKAAAMAGQLTEAEKAKRSEKMLELHELRAQEYEENMIGRELEILIEEETEIGGKVFYLSHSREYVKVAVEKQEGIGINDLLTVKIADFAREHILLGKPTENSPCILR
nr:tRNA (N(6)-L-threonylcarbamoyladenosine(37)-C(2))-methylthiotransferase MtaB [uncultured Blautia sp.]